MLPQEATHVAATLAVNCCCAPSASVGLVGEMVKAGAGPTVSTAFAVYAVPVAAVAVILQTLPWAGEAVKRPLAVMLPQEAAQVTFELAVNCCVCPWPVVALAGEITMGDVTFALAVAVWPLPSLAVPVIVQDPGTSGAV
jgi:hypothetical protein